MTRKSTPIAAKLFLAGMVAGWPGAAAAQDHRNPVDKVSNPESLEFADVVIGVPDLTETFQREGPVHDARFFAAIMPGMTQADIQAKLGQPRWQDASGSAAWNYNFQFLLPGSDNYLVCQYKVIFDGNQRVRETVWRRRQCRKLAAGS